MTMNQDDHDEIIDQVISLEDDFGDPTSAIANVPVSDVENDPTRMMANESSMNLANSSTPQHQLISLTESNQPIPQLTQSTLHHQQSQHSHQQPCSMPVDSNLCDHEQQQNQLSFSSEDLLNLLLEFDKDSPNLNSNITLDQDEKVGIETIRKQLMSCEVQSDHLPLQPQQQDGTPSISSPVTYQAHQTQQHPSSALHQHQSTQHQQSQQLISQTAPVIPTHQQNPPLLTGLSLQQQRHQLPQHHQRLSVDQSLLNGLYSASPVNFVPVSSSSQSFSPQHQHQNVTRICQSNNSSIDNPSPSPSWQQSQQSMSPFSPQPNQHLQQQPSTPKPAQHHSGGVTATHLQHHLQQHHPQPRSPSQSVSPPVTTTSNPALTSEPSPVVKKNPLLNAQLVNSRAPLLTPSRFLINQPNVLHQNPILNSKLSRSPFSPTSSAVVQNSLDQNSQQQTDRYIQPHSHRATSNFDYDLNQPTNARMGVYRHSSEQPRLQLQSVDQMYVSRPDASIASNVSSSVVTQPMMALGSGIDPNQQMKQDLRRKVQQSKQPQQPTTSLLKQLLSDDNK